MVVFVEKWLYLDKLFLFEENGCIQEMWLYSGKNYCIRAKVVVIRKSGCDRAKILVFGQGG